MIACRLAYQLNQRQTFIFYHFIYDSLDTRCIIKVKNIYWCYVFDACCWWCILGLIFGFQKEFFQPMEFFRGPSEVEFDASLKALSHDLRQCMLSLALDFTFDPTWLFTAQLLIAKQFTGFHCTWGVSVKKYIYNVKCMLLLWMFMPFLWNFKQF